MPWSRVQKMTLFGLHRMRSAEEVKKKADLKHIFRINKKYIKSRNPPNLYTNLGDSCFCSSQSFILHIAYNLYGFLLTFHKWFQQHCGMEPLCVKPVFFYQFRSAAVGAYAALGIIQAENGTAALFKFKIMQLAG